MMYSIENCSQHTTSVNIIHICTSNGTWVAPQRKWTELCLSNIVAGILAAYENQNEEENQNKK